MPMSKSINGQGGSLRSVTRSMIVGAVTGVLTTARAQLKGPVTWTKVGGNANLSVDSSGAISASAAIAAGASQTINLTATGADGCVQPWAMTFVGAAAPAPPVQLWGGVTFANDGSVGDTFSAPAAMTGIAWHRMAVTSDAAMTAIAAANGGSYVATNADGPAVEEVARFFLVARGTLNGVLTDAICSLPVMKASRVIFPLNSIAGATVSGGAALSLDANGQVVMEGTGTVNAEARWPNLANEDPTTWGVVAGMVDISQGDRFIIQNARVTPIVNGTDAYVANVTTAANPKNLSTSDIPDFFGKKPFAFHQSEVPALNTPGVVPTGLGLRHSGAATNTARTVYAALRANAKSFPIFIDYLDDNFASQWTVLKPIYDAFGIKVNIALATNLLGLADRQTEAQILQWAAEGHDICVDGRADAQPGPNFPMDGPTGTITSMNAIRSWLDARGLTRARDHLVLEYGYPYQVPLDPYYAGATATSDGSDTITISAQTGSGTIAVGRKVEGALIPTGARVTAINGAQVKLDALVPARSARLVRFVNDSHEYHPWRFIDRLKAEGIKTARRASLGGLNYYRGGWGDTAMNMAALDTNTGGGGGNFTTQLKPTIDLSLKRGGLCAFLSHGGAATTPTGNDTLAQTTYDMLSYRVAKANAGECVNMTISRSWAVTGGQRWLGS